MAKPEKKPIMSEGDERFMAFSGLIDWTRSVISQARRIQEADAGIADAVHGEHQAAASEARCQHHFFAIAAHKAMEHRKWAASHGLFNNVDFSDLDEFSEGDIRDLRNMREHVIDYFTGKGRDAERWTVETPEYSSDASGYVSGIIGGRLDWRKFADAAENLLPRLLAEPVPYPAR